MADTMGAMLQQNNGQWNTTDKIHDNVVDTANLRSNRFRLHEIFADGLAEAFQIRPGEKIVSIWAPITALQLERRLNASQANVNKALDATASLTPEACAVAKGIYGDIREQAVSLLHQCVAERSGGVGGPG